MKTSQLIVFSKIYLFTKGNNISYSAYQLEIILWHNKSDFQQFTMNICVISK